MCELHAADVGCEDGSFSCRLLFFETLCNDSYELIIVSSAYSGAIFSSILNRKYV